MDDDEEPRPSCSCKTSHCIQRYCHCFGGRWYCSDACRCEGCLNTEDRESFVEERAKLILKKKPGAFRSKIITSVGDPSSSGKEQRRHVKGCTCRRSGCNKKYCECFKNEVACTARCQCEGCANRHGTGGDASLLHNNGRPGGASGDSNGTSDDGCNGSGTPEGSNGTSNETAVITDEESHSPTGAVVTENVEASGNPCDLDPGVVDASNGGDLDDMPSSYFYEGSYLHQYAHPQTHQGPVQAMPSDNFNSTPQGPSYPATFDIDNGNQNDFSWN